MARHPSTYVPILTAADRFEPRLRRDVVAATLRLRTKVSVRELASLIEAKDSRRAVAYIRSLDIRSIMAGATGPVTEAFTYGGKVGATRVKPRRKVTRG